MKRLTKQRKALLNCLTESPHPLGVEEIHALVAQEIPEVNISTVYRNLKSLTEEHLVHVVTVAGGVNRYEILNKVHYHHFHCRKCDRVFNISFCPQDIALMIPKGFVMLDHHITLNGYCETCR